MQTAPIHPARGSHTSIPKHAREPVQAAHTPDIQIADLGRLHVKRHEPRGTSVVAECRLQSRVGARVRVVVVGGGLSPLSTALPAGIMVGAAAPARQRGEGGVDAVPVGAENELAIELR